jgi:hypothetical protein
MNDYFISSKKTVGRDGRQNAPVAKPTHNPPNNKLAQPLIA